jgi:threonine/homoserine/homoserine lactone efflux protein
MVRGTSAERVVYNGGMAAHLILSSHFRVFLLAALLLAIAPGPGILYVTARTLAGGKSDGFVSVLGTSVGGLAHVLLATLGLSALLAASAQAFVLVKYLGALYLLYLGVRSLLDARRVVPVPVAARPGLRRTFLQGALTETLNVKTALFFLAFIPQFIDHGFAAAPQFAFYGLICVIFNMMADLVVVLLAARLAGYFRQSAKPARALRYGSGAMLLGLGTYVALSD